MALPFLLRKGVLMNKLVNNLNSIQDTYVEDPHGLLSTIQLGRLVGSEKIYVNLDRIQPGAKSCKYHSHTKQEEFFLILSGSGILRMNDEQYEVKKGDFVSKPAGMLTNLLIQVKKYWKFLILGSWILMISFPTQMKTLFISDAKKLLLGVRIFLQPGIQILIRVKGRMFN
jgi:quercetin dioxygenase-like cupin family protein